MISTEQLYLHAKVSGISNTPNTFFSMWDMFIIQEAWNNPEKDYVYSRLMSKFRSDYLKFTVLTNLDYPIVEGISIESRARQTNMTLIYDIHTRSWTISTAQDFLEYIKASKRRP